MSVLLLHKIRKKKTGLEFSSSEKAEPRVKSYGSLTEN